MIEDKNKTNQDDYISPGIFKAYDVRGKYPEEINESVAYFIGRAFVKFIRCSQKDNDKIVIGRDNRLSSDSLFVSLARGINDERGKITDIGLATTPMLYFASAHYGFDGGVMISASHNPPRYNGFKLVKSGALPVSGETGIKEIKSIVENMFQDSFQEKRILPAKLASVKKDVLSDYLDFNFNHFNVNSFGKFKIVIDTANAVPGILIPEIFQRSRFEIHHLFGELDGSFPNHNPDPLIEDNIEALKKEILVREADLGVAFDGDGDRIVFLNEKGEVVPADLISALLAKYILKNNPGRKILYDVRSSNVVREVILENGGEPVVGRVGHSFIKEKMRRDNIIFAGEFSGHFYHQEHYFSEAPLFVFLKIIEILSLEKKLFSQVINPFRKYWHSGEINFKTENKEEKIAQLKKRYKDGRISEIDGLRVDFARWWFLVRASNTEPLLRLIVEAKDKELMDKMVEELGQFISS